MNSTLNKENPIQIREIDDFEIRFFFNPSVYSADIDQLKAILTRASLRTGVSGAELKNIGFGEFLVHFNPAISNKKDRELVKKFFTDYFDSLANSL